MSPIAVALAAQQARITQTALVHAKPLRCLRLIAVSKTFPVEDVADAYDAGQRDFGENYVQEGIEKIEWFQAQDLHATWHLIGPLQSNKTRQVAERFDWVHTVDRVKIALRLSDQRPKGLAPLQICLQVNISGETSKAGLQPDEVLDLALEIARQHREGQLPGCQLRGLMAVPAPAATLAEQRQPFAALARLLESCNRALGQEGLPPLDVLSMGMSADLEAAIQEAPVGVTTLLRVGSAIFGSRQ